MKMFVSVRDSRNGFGVFIHRVDWPNQDEFTLCREFGSWKRASIWAEWLRCHLGCD